MTLGRQVQFRCGSTVIDLNDATYVLLADNGFASFGKALEIKFRVEPTTLTQLDRLLAPLRKLCTMAEMYNTLQIGEPVEVWTKVCDALTETAEFGATWLRKRVRSGSVIVNPLTGTAAVPAAIVTLSLEVEPAWRRALPASVLVASSSSTSVRDDGGLTVPAGGTLTARRVTWTATTGLTVRVRWLYSDNDCLFFFAETGANDMKALYNAADNKLYIYDDGGNSASSSALTATAGDELDLVFKWDPTTPKLGIWVNGVANGSDAHGTLDAADTYQVFAPSTVSQHLLSWQLWPAALTDVECAELYVWGRPEPELLYTIAPSDTKNTNCQYPFYNPPGDAPGGLRILATAGANEDQIRLALRPLRMPSALKFECESGTLGTDTATASDTDASGGSVARFTPSATTWDTRVTATIVSNPSGLAAYVGDYRLFVALKDNAANVNVNALKFRVVVGGVAGDWSDSVSAATVATRSIVDLGVFSLPPGSWPEEAEDAATTGYGSAYVTIELQASNTVGSGGGTLDMDALYLAPTETEGVAQCADWAYATQTAVLDWTGKTPAGILAYDDLSLEFGGWVNWVGHDLTLIPVLGGAGVLWGYTYRDGNEQAWPNDTVTLTFYYEPRWRW